MQNLPKSLLDISFVIGIEKTLEIVNIFKGQRVYVPHQIPEKWQFYSVLGQDLALKFHHVFKGTYISVPSTTDKIDKFSNRNDAIRADRASMSNNELVSKYNLSRRQIQKIVNDTQKTPF